MIKEQDNKLFIFSIIKIILLVLLLVYIGILFAMKGNSKTPFSVVAEKVDKEMKAESLIKADGQLLKRYYGLNNRNYEGVLLYVSESAMDVSEVLFVKVNDNTQIDEVERAVDTRVKTQKNNFDGYGVEQTKLLRNAIVETKGNYVFMVISPNAAKIQKVFRKEL